MRQRVAQQRRPWMDATPPRHPGRRPWMDATPPRHPGRRQLGVLILTAAVATVFAAPANAQRPVGLRGGWNATRTGATRMPAVKTVSAAKTDFPCVTGTCTACATFSPRFWIVSTRRCRSRRGPCCRFDQFLYENGRCIPQRDPNAIHGWLTPGAPVCVVVHGSFTGFRPLLRESCELCRWLHAPAPHRPLNIVVFTWPSDDYPTGLFPIDITVLGRRSGFHGLYLARFLSTLPAGSRVCLIGHSHGARTVSAALHLHAGGTVQGERVSHPQPCVRRYRAVFLAAAIDHHWLDPHERYGRALCSAEALLNLRNRGDFPLTFYPLRKPFGRGALARTGFTNRDRRKLGNLNAKVRELDVTAIIGEHHMWLHYFRQPAIAMAIAPYVHFTDDDALDGAAASHPSRDDARITPRRDGPTLQSPAATGRSSPAVRETFSRIRRVSLHRR